MTEDIYKQVGYGGVERVGFGRKPGVAVVDFQRAFTDPRFPLGGRPLVERAVSNTATLLNAARAANVPVALCYTAYAISRAAPHWKVPVVPRDFIHGHPCTELEPRIYDPDYDAYFVKTAPSIFFETGAVQYFITERVDTVIVVGCTTSGCIRASVIDAFSYGFRVMVPEPCVGDMDEGPHHANLEDVGKRYADILTLEETLTHIEDYRKSNVE